MFVCSIISTIIFLPYVTSSIISERDLIKTIIQKQSFPNILRKKQTSSSTAKFDNFNNEFDSKMPDFFDSREQWPMCDSLSTIRDHKLCGASWAFTAVATMTDRLCIQTRGKIKFEFSPQDLISCCKECGGCGIGNATEAWKFWVLYGIVSGGDFGSYKGCRPYSESTAHDAKVNSCKQKCHTGYRYSYSEDKHYGESFYQISGKVSIIQTEIMTNGPVQAGLEVYEDFFDQIEGVYRHKNTSKYIGYTYVKILGWGKENSVPYWLCVAPWGSDFGFFKILRGQNEAGIEQNVIAGKALLNRFTFKTSSSSPLCFSPISIRSFSMMITESWWTFLMTFWPVVNKI